MIVGVRVLFCFNTVYSLFLYPPDTSAFSALTVLVGHYV